MDVAHPLGTQPTRRRVASRQGDGRPQARTRRAALEEGTASRHGVARQRSDAHGHQRALGHGQGPDDGQELVGTSPVDRRQEAARPRPVSASTRWRRSATSSALQEPRSTSPLTMRLVADGERPRVGQVGDRQRPGPAAA